jgi:hypothetical protein
MSCGWSPSEEVIGNSSRKFRVFELIASCDSDAGIVAFRMGIVVLERSIVVTRVR